MLARSHVNVKGNSDNKRRGEKDKFLRMATAPSFQRQCYSSERERSHWREIDLFSYLILHEMSEDELQGKGGDENSNSLLKIASERDGWMKSHKMDKHTHKGRYREYHHLQVSSSPSFINSDR